MLIKRSICHTRFSDKQPIQLLNETSAIDNNKNATDDPNLSFLLSRSLKVTKLG